jgi:GAF domain-containing protein
VQPIPQVLAVSSRLKALADETLDLLDDLRAVSALAEELISSCVGVSLTVLVDGEPFTVTAATEDLNTVDAAQYLEDGPCVEATLTGRQYQVEDVLDEDRWQSFAQTAAARGIRSSLSIPLRKPDGAPIGALNLYASDPSAFVGQNEIIAGLFGVHVEGAVHNADLSFLSRQRAERLPEQIADFATVSTAIGIFMERRRIGSGEARERIESAAARADIPLAKAAVLIIQLAT